MANPEASNREFLCDSWCRAALCPNLYLIIRYRQLSQSVQTRPLLIGLCASIIGRNYDLKSFLQKKKHYGILMIIGSGSNTREDKPDGV